MRKKLKRLTSMALAFILSASAFPVTAFGASDSTSTLAEVTAKFIDAENGKEIIQPETYSVTHEEKSPQEIENYTYVDYAESVEYVYSHKDLTYIIGYPDESVRPDASMTRAEAATVFYRLYDGEYPAFTRRMSNGTFEDVKADYWFYKEVETLYNIGILEGADEHKFSPDEPVTRAEFAVMAARFADLDYKGGNIFDDVPNGHWAYSYINAAANAGWVKGYPDGSFRPDEPISRAEVVTLVNGMINRSVTLGKLKELGVKCPYNDLVEKHWSYCDLMEATVPHSAEEWHGLSYNDGIYNIIVEKFVDQNGAELAESITTAGKEEVSPKAIPAYEYRGYIRTVVYQYTNGDAAPSIKKTADVQTANVSDTLTYTIKLTNGEAATSAWKEVVLTDDLPDGLTFVDSSVYVDGKSAEHSFKDGMLSVAVGDIAAGQTVTVTFKATVNNDMYNQTIYNTAVAEGTNGMVKDEDGNETGKYEDTDDGVYINKGDTMPYVTKNASTSEAQVGDKVTYTIKLGNAESAVYEIENASMTDAIPAELDFVDGSVQVDGMTADYSFDNETRTLTVPLDSIAPATEKTVTFSVTINDAAYGKTVYNTAVLSGDNITDTEDTDDGVSVGDGKARPSVEKRADMSVANVGDKITYTVTFANGEFATVPIENAVMTDVIPADLAFVDGSVQVDGVTTEYSFDSRIATLTVPLGELAPNTTKTVTFAATVNESAYGKTVYNTAVMSGDNIPDTEGTDDGVSVGNGKARPSIEKSSDKSSAKVGDKITYTLTLSNSETATVPVENAVVTDVIPAGLTFEYGSVMLDGSGTSDFTYDENTRLLTVNIGSIEPDTSHTVTFVATVNEDAYNTTIQNLATLTSDNTEPVQDKDDGVMIADGRTDLAIVKSVSTATAKVGDTLTYTVEVSNGAGAEVNIRDAVMADTIPDGLTFRGNVTVDGYSAAYQYDNESQTLSVPLDAIAPGQTKTVSFDALVNSDAYGMTIENTAIASGSNTPDAEDTDDGVTIEDGTPDGHAGAKSANKTTARVGDTITYTITLQNGALATAAWTGATVTDVLPDGVTFTGIVQKDGQATTEYSYEAASRTLTLTPSAIQPGQQVSYTFDVTVDEGMQGEFIVNTAILTDGDEQTPLPDAGVEIDEGEADPIVTKAASVSEANVGDTFTYEITVKNGDKATAPWRNVVAYDTLPAGVQLVGNVYLDGKVALHKLNGNALSVLVGDLAAGESVTVSFDVQVLDAAAGTTLQNSVNVAGDNGNGTATDDGVTVPELEPQNPINPTGFYVTKDVDKTVVDVSKGASDEKRTATFTITVGNNSSETWKNVVLKDTLDTSLVTPVLQDNVYVDGVLSGDWSFAGKVFSLELGDIAPGQSHTITLTLQFKNDSGGKTYVNYATGEGDNGNATGKSPEIELRSNVLDDEPVITDRHYLLFTGYGENMWRPSDRISLQEACIVAYRLISDGGNTWLDRGTVTVPEYEYSISEEAKYFVSIGVLPPSCFDTTQMTEGVDYEISYEVSEKGYLRIWANSNQLNTLVKYIAGTNAGLSGDVSRLNFAKLICQVTGRDTNPDTSAYSGHIHHFTDVNGSSVGLVTEVSHEHDYILDADGNEYWI